MRTHKSVLSRKYSPPGTNAYATVNVLNTSYRAVVSIAMVNVFARCPFDAARLNTTGNIEDKKSAKFMPPI